MKIYLALYVLLIAWTTSEAILLGQGIMFVDVSSMLMVFLLSFLAFYGGHKYHYNKRLCCK